MDCSLYDLATKRLLDMGTEWDTFEEESHVANATGVAKENRQLLHGVMNKVGWLSYEQEWWHFELVGARDLGVFDVCY